VATCLRRITEISAANSKLARKFSSSTRRPVSDNSQAKTSDLFAEERYKTSPLIVQVNPVNPGVGDKP
jgi:hypothetical protein